MKPSYLTIYGATNSPIYTSNTYVTPFNVGFGVKVTGTINYTVQHTFDDVTSSTFNAATATWFDHPTIASKTDNQDGNYAFPVTAIRVKGNSGSGTAVLAVIQAGLTQG